MTEDKNLVTSELNIFFNEWGEIGMGGGMHIKLILPGQPTLATLDAIVHRLNEWAKTRQAAKNTETTEPPWTQPRQETQDTTSRDTPAHSDIPGLPHCPRTGIWASAKGRYPEGFKADWKHNDPKVNTQGQFYCPTPVGKDKATGQLIWCTWRARELDDGTYEEYEVTAKE